MVRFCCAVGYTMRDTKESRKDGFSFYGIPAKGEKRRLWLNAIKRKDYDPPSSATIIPYAASILLEVRYFPK